MSFQKLSLVKILRLENYFGSIKFQCGVFRNEIPKVYQDSRILKLDVPLEKVWTLIWISILTISHRLNGPTFMMFTVIYAIINWEIIGFRKSSPKFSRIHWINLTSPSNWSDDKTLINKWVCEWDSHNPIMNYSDGRMGDKTMICKWVREWDF